MLVVRTIAYSYNQRIHFVYLNTITALGKGAAFLLSPNFNLHLINLMSTTLPNM